ncbi:luminal-binding protein 8-like [Primulina huaijiensis]|uniref:luminal-binding protein 8-like n=1 Tax=Primulina huaijiensis TaxID=1492673 RepID=UPI003CC75F71
MDLLIPNGLKASCKSEKITITNDKGRLSQEEIERMVKEAEEFAEEDKKIKERIDARNSLETYVYNMRNQITTRINSWTNWRLTRRRKSRQRQRRLSRMDDNHSAEKEEEVEAVCNPIITAVYQRSGGPKSEEEDVDEEITE